MNTNATLLNTCQEAGEGHQHRLAHQCSSCEKIVHTCSVKLNIMGIWEWGIYVL